MRSSTLAGLIPVLSSLTAPASALPWTAPTTSVQYTATFEDKSGNAITPLGSPIGTYRGLSFTNFNIFQQALANQGLEPHTVPNTAVFGSVITLLTGGTTGTLTADYDGSQVISFDLEQLYFGCTLYTQESTINVPAACTVAFTARDKEGNELASQEEDFDAGTQMQFVQFGKDFEGVYSVDFSVQGTLQNLLTVGATDSVQYTVHQASEVQAD